MTANKRAREILHRLRAKRESRKEETRYAEFVAQRFRSSDELVRSHFATWSHEDHVNFQGILLALQCLGGAPANILETGTSAWGTDSTRLWDSYVRNFGGQLWSVDISEGPKKRLHGQLSQNSHLVVDDSVEFIERFRASAIVDRIDLCYLDSWDLDWSDPEPAEIHGLREWLAIKPILGHGSVLVVDDTPADLSWIPSNFSHNAAKYLRARGRLPGKGSLIDRELVHRKDVTKLWHGYNCVYLFGSDFNETL